MNPETLGPIHYNITFGLFVVQVRWEPQRLWVPFLEEQTNKQKEPQNLGIQEKEKLVHLGKHSQFPCVAGIVF